MWRVFRSLALIAAISWAICSGLYGLDLLQPTPGLLERPFYGWITPALVVFTLLLLLSMPCALAIALFALFETVVSRRWAWHVLAPILAVAGVLLAIWTNEAAGRFAMLNYVYIWYWPSVFATHPIPVFANEVEDALVYALAAVLEFGYMWVIAPRAWG